MKRIFRKLPRDVDAWLAKMGEPWAAHQGGRNFMVRAIPEIGVVQVKLGKSVYSASEPGTRIVVTEKRGINAVGVARRI